jgi:NADH-quinone oxidoreductase E subunit
MSSSFEYTPENQKKFEQILKRYPVKRAAMLPALHLAIAQIGYISEEVEKKVAELLEVPLVDVREVVSFYSLFNQKKLGKHHIRVCTSLSCWIRGCDGVREQLEKKLGLPDGGVSEDGNLSWESVPDCLGACELAPMLQLDGYFEGNLTEEKIDEIVARVKSK